MCWDRVVQWLVEICEFEVYRLKIKICGFMICRLAHLRNLRRPRKICWLGIYGQKSACPTLICIRIACNWEDFFSLNRYRYTILSFSFWEMCTFLPRLLNKSWSRKQDFFDKYFRICKISFHLILRIRVKFALPVLVKRYWRLEIDPKYLPLLY